jgi:hypothetical protein
MRTSDGLIAAWRSVASLSPQIENDILPLDQATIRARVEETSAWLRERADGNGVGALAPRLEMNAKGWSPGSHLAAYRALLPELAALDNDEGVVFGLMREIKDNLVRDLVAADYIAILAATRLFGRAQTAINFLEFAHPQIRFKALLAIASASHEPHDLFVACSSADRLIAVEKVRAYLDVYGLTRNPNDLFLARHVAAQLEPPDRLIACEHIALASNEATDYLNALEAAEAVGFRAVVRTLAQIAAAFSPQEKNPMSKETLAAIIASPKINAYHEWKEDMLCLLKTSS